MLDWLHAGHWQTVAIPFRCILVDWRAGRDGKMIFYKRPCFAKSETGTESMPYRAWNQSRSTLGIKCCFGPRCCRYHWICCFEAASQLCMILLPTATRFVTYIHWSHEDMCSEIFSLRRHTLHDTYLHVGRGWPHSSCYDRFGQNRFYEDQSTEKHDIDLINDSDHSNRLLLIISAPSRLSTDGIH